MLTSKLGVVLILVTIALIHNTLAAWNIFPSLSKTSIENFTREKLASLRNQRNRLEHRLTQEKAAEAAAATSSTLLNQNDNSERLDKMQLFQNMTTVPLINPVSNETTTTTNAAAITKDGSFNSSEILRENLIQQILPNKEEIFTKITEVGDKLVEMKERLEPEVKKFLTETYNSFLSNLVPYSETIGVPTYVLNSLKIPQNFDPRLQFVQSMLKSLPFKTILDSFQQLGHSRKLMRVDDVQGKSDDQDLVSDQEPGFAGQMMKYSHNSRHKSHPNTRGGGDQTTYLISDRNGYEFGDYSGDANGHDVGESMQKGYYVDGDGGDDTAYEDTGSDMIQAAGNNVARGHSRGDYGGGGGGYGHGGGGGGGGLTDPFTILGGLAFLTYLAMLIQQQMAATNPMGREELPVNVLSEDMAFLQTIPLILNKLMVKNHELQRTSSSSTSHNSIMGSVIANFQKRMATARNKNRKGDGPNSVTAPSSKSKCSTGLCRTLKKSLKKLHHPNNSTDLLLKLNKKSYGSSNNNHIIL